MLRAPPPWRPATQRSHTRRTDMTVTASLPAAPARPAPSGFRRPWACIRALRGAVGVLTMLGLLLATVTAQADEIRPSGTLTDESPGWTELDTGLQLGIFPAPDAPDGPERIVAVRIDPAYYEFSLHTTSEEGEPALSLTEWARRHDLNAVINASMYLPDARTSTGYLRNGAHLNNPRIGGNLGAFFVFGPLSPDLPQADLLDRTADPWEELLPQYRSAVQNYRLIGANRRILWPQGGPLYSVAAVGQDGSGAILFLHCREPLTAWRFATILLALPIDIRDVMYVEGGPQAGLYLRTPMRSDIWMGRHLADFWSGGNAAAPLPNVLGARRRATPPQPGLFPDGRERPVPQF
ncbi:phosphodiester glycosidase family protein [Nitratidesulfovibrio termitidis]|uniref:phosphodiester glycosidase family protein n=1 Tax=Nitratidesulfovibrio termitidis TaxID=42252 RepID=UPI001FE15DFD|nr:phosphodiester glycosidase family protein [Nitratidesulfovibrio termitidis]